MTTPSNTTPFNQRTAARLRAIIGAQSVNITAMSATIGKTRGYIDTRLRCVVPLSVDDLSLLGDYLGYTPDELISTRFTLHEDALTDTPATAGEAR